MTVFVIPDKFKEPLIASALRTRVGDFLPQAYGTFHSAWIVDDLGRIIAFQDFVSISTPIVLNPRVLRSIFHRLSVWYSIKLVVEGRLPMSVTTRFRFPRSGIFSSSDTAIAKNRLSTIRRLRLSFRTKPKRVPYASSSYSSQRKNPETGFIPLPQYSWTSNGGVTRDSSTQVQVYSRSWSGTRTPNFGKLKSEGRTLPINPHSSSIWHAIITPYVRFDTEDVWQFNPSPFSTATIDPMTSRYNFPAEPSLNTKAIDIASRRLFEKSDSNLTGNIGQDFAQYGQTFDLIGGNAKKISGALNDLRKGNIPGAVKTLWSTSSPKFRRRGGPSKTKDLANNWLELQYGWKPLLQDIRDSMEALARYNLANADIVHVTGSATVEDKVTSDVGLFEYGAVVGGKLITTTNSHFKYGLRYQISSHLVSFLAQTGFTNTLSLEWEILPFSFVVDWFLPVGNWLQTFSAWDGLQFLDGYTTSFVRQRATLAISYSGQPVPSDPHYTFTANGSMTREWVKLSRGTLSSFPSGRFPQFKNPFSIVHVSNALALLRQAFGAK